MPTPPAPGAPEVVRAPQVEAAPAVAAEAPAEPMGTGWTIFWWVVAIALLAACVGR